MSSTESSEALRNRESLCELYYSTFGQDWIHSTNWLSPLPLASWFGVETDANGLVARLCLSRNGLKGNLPPTVKNLSGLEYLDLSHNRLGEPVARLRRTLNGVGMLFFVTKPARRTEGIPLELGQLTNLKTLDLSHNHYRWDIPTSFSRLTALQDLDLSHNRLTGLLPADLSNLNQLLRLNLSHNRFDPRVFQSLVSLPNLNQVELGHQEKPGDY